MNGERGPAGPDEELHHDPEGDPPSGSQQWAQELLRINNEQANELRTVTRQVVRAGEGRQATDEALFDELSRVNNELANIQRELVKANQELQRLNEEKNRFLGMAAHDLRTPLVSITAFSQFLEDDARAKLSAEELHFIQVIRRSGDFLLRLVNDLLDVAAIESGRLELRPRPGDLCVLVAETARLVQPLAAAKGLEVRVVCEHEVPRFAFDADRVEQVLTNLLSNAIKFSEAGGVVTVTTVHRDGAALVSVADRGVGIPEKLLPDLFHPLGKAGRRGTAGEESTGLGLTIVRRIVEAHGGSIGVASRVGVGTTFTFSLPLAP